MTMPVNYQNGLVPNHSGITINITNPVVNPPMNPQYQNCCPQYSVNQNVPYEATSNSMGYQKYPEYPANYYMNNYNAQQPQVVPENMQYGQIQKPYVQVPQQPVVPENMQYGQVQYPYAQMPQNQLQPQTVNYSVNAPVYNNQYPNNNVTTTEKAGENEEVQNKDELDQKALNQVVEEEPDLSVSSDIIKDIDAMKAEQAELEKNSKKTRIVALTNEYIMSLENYLNNPNKEIRLMAAQEILTRLDEDKDRYDDAALNALLNKMLQDPEKLVRIAALSAFSSQLASGNDYTVQLLQNIQSNPNADKEDVVQAAKILLKMSAGTEIKYVPIKKDDSKKASSEQTDANKQQIEQLQNMLRQYKERDIEAMLKQQQ